MKLKSRKSIIWILLFFLIILSVVILIKFFPKIRTYYYNEKYFRNLKAEYPYFTPLKPYYIVSDFIYTPYNKTKLIFNFLCNETEGCINNQIGINFCIDKNGKSIYFEDENYYLKFEDIHGITSVKNGRGLDIHTYFFIYPYNQVDEFLRLNFPITCNIVVYSSEIEKIPNCSVDTCYIQTKINLTLKK